MIDANAGMIKVYSDISIVIHLSHSNSLALSK